MGEVNEEGDRIFVVEVKSLLRETFSVLAKNPDEAVKRVIEESICPDNTERDIQETEVYDEKGNLL